LISRSKKAIEKHADARSIEKGRKGDKSERTNSGFCWWRWHGRTIGSSWSCSGLFIGGWRFCY
jgi:hypothetical protein